MLIRLTGVLAIIVSCCGPTIAQEVQPSYKIVDNIAESFRSATTLERTWPAVLRVLMEMEYRPTLAEKQSGVLEAIFNRSEMEALGVKLNTGELSGVSIIFEERVGGVSISIVWRTGIGGPATAKKFYKEFFDRLDKK